MSFDNITSPQMEHAQVRLRSAQRSFSKTQNELQTLITNRSQTPMSTADSINNAREIRALEARLMEMAEEISRLKETIEKQRITIANQSKTISQPKVPYVTPGRGMGPGQTSSFGDSQPNFPPPPQPLYSTDANPNPSSFHQGAPDQTHSFPGVDNQSPYGQQQSSFYGANVHRSGSSSGIPSQPLPTSSHQGQPSYFVNAFGSPESRLQNNRTPGYHPSAVPSSNGSGSKQSPAQMLGPPSRGTPALNSSEHSRAPSADNSLALTKARSDVREQEPKESFSKLMNLAQLYAFNHVNTPSTHKDNGMPKAIKERLLKAASPTTAFTLMSTPYTRFYLVTKVIVQWLLKNVFKYDAFSGLDHKIDSQIDGLRASIYHSTPAQVHFQILTNIAQQITQLARHTKFEDYLQHVARERSSQLWAVVKPMMHQKTARDWEDLLTLVTEAHKIAVKMFSCADEFRFEIPPVGTQFQPEIMMARDHHQGDQQQDRGTPTIRLGITPHVTVRSYSPEGHLKTSTVISASVLLR